MKMVVAGQISPAVPADNPPMVLVLDCLACDIQETLGLLIAVLIHMEVQVQVPLLSKGENPAEDEVASAPAGSYR